MLRLMIQKLVHKKWMVFSLLIGNILLVAIAASHPLYRNASLQRMLTDGFEEVFDTTNVYPGTLSMSSAMKKTQNSAEFYKLLELSENFCADMELPEYMRLAHYHVQPSKSVFEVDRNAGKREVSVKIGMMTELEDHVKIRTGQMYANTMTEDGCFEAIVSESTLVKLNLIIGDVLNFKTLRGLNGENVRVKIVGTFENANENDAYWVNSPDGFIDEVFISEEIFMSNFLVKEKLNYNVTGQWHVMFDYTAMKPEKVDKLLTFTNSIADETISLVDYVPRPEYLQVLENYNNYEKRVSVTLIILQVPVLVLLCAFLFMISGQLINLEDNEISLLKSRGASRWQIFSLYMMQSGLLAAIGFVTGLPIAAYICRILGSSNAFLEFVKRRPLDTEYSLDVLLIAGVAVLVSVLMTVLPALKSSKLSIVNLKQKKARTGKRFWQKFYLDIVIFGVSIYGYYSFGNQKEEMIKRVVSGGSLDPLLFLCSSLFILGAGLLALRIQPILVKLIYTVNRKRWKPANYASFLQIMRTGSKQYFIMIFLILTIALGIFNATVARTILANSEAYIRYANGADLIISEKWKSNQALAAADPTVELTYKEPDFSRYLQFDEVQSAAKVYISNDAYIRNGKEQTVVNVYGIHTKDFGKVTSMDNSLLPYHYYEYLNVMAKKSDAVILSYNFKQKLGYNLGDKIIYYNKKGEAITAKVYGFVEYWPGYVPTSMKVTPDGGVVEEQNYMILAHLTTVQTNWGVLPYTVWLDVKDSTDFFYGFAEEQKIDLNYVKDTKVLLIENRNDTLFQGTNGILTMSFIIILILCIVGYLIYWILSIRSRELLFGVFRAMGMSKREIIHMLINEQLFSGVLSIGIGALIGVISSRLFVPMIQIAYSASNQVLPLRLITQSNDMVRLFTVVGVVFIFCMIILASLIYKLKISQALKLGED